MKVFAKIIEVSYEDNYENGMVGHFNDVLIDNKIFDTVDEAVKFFGDTYRYDKNSNIELLDDGIMILGRDMCINGFYGFEEATDQELTNWKKGKINLWSVEYQMKLMKLEEFTFDELKKYSVK